MTPLCESPKDARAQHMEAASQVAQGSTACTRQGRQGVGVSAPGTLGSRGRKKPRHGAFLTLPR